MIAIAEPWITPEGEVLRDQCSENHMMRPTTAKAMSRALATKRCESMSMGDAS